MLKSYVCICARPFHRETIHGQDDKGGSLDVQGINSNMINTSPIEMAKIVKSIKRRAIFLVKKKTKTSWAGSATLEVPVRFYFSTRKRFGEKL